MEREERLTASPHLPAVEVVSQPVEKTFVTPSGAQSQSSTSQDERQPELDTDAWELQQSQGEAAQLEFQESGLSPALSLLPATYGVEHEFTESFFSQQSNPEFAPLRQYPDFSGTSKEFLIPPQDCTTHSECSSLSQHTLVQAAVPSEEETNSCCVLPRCEREAPRHPSSALQPSPLMSLGHFSDVSFEEDLTLSSSQESYIGVKVGASLGSSSAVSLELDNYAPYWTSKQSSPPLPSKPQEFNIDEQVLVYLHNLGIDQGRSKNLTASTPRGPIRKPEFSSTDLCTVEGSPGTPSKSTQPPEVKGEFSRPSVQSVDSSTPVPSHLDSLGPAALIPEQVRTRTSPPPDAEASQGKARVAPLQSSQSTNQDAESSFSRAKTLSENCKPFYHSENIISAGSSAASSVSVPAYLFSDEDIFRSFQIKPSRLQDSSFSSHSTAGGLRARSSLIGARSSSDSMLTSETTRQISVGQERMTSSWQPDYPSAQNATTVTYNILQDGAAGANAETTRVISKSAQRTEPEGCSAASPDKVPTQLQAMKPSPAASTKQLNVVSADRGGISGEGEVEKPTPGVPAAESHSSSSVVDDADQEVMSDVSSESSLAVRVAKLLRDDSPATMVSSTPSITDQEEGKSKEWLKLKVPGQRSETPELDVEDRKRIEDIKKELLLRNPIKSQGSTDTESSVSSSLGVNKEHSPPPSETFSTLTYVNNQKDLNTDRLDSHTQLRRSLRPEAQVREVAAAEGETLLTKNPHTLTPIVTSTLRRSTSTSPSASPVPPLSPAAHPLHLTELSTDAGDSTKTKKPVPTNLGEKEAVALGQTLSSEPPPVDETSNGFHRRNQSVTRPSASWSQNRLVSPLVGGAPPSPTLDLDEVNESVRRESTRSFNYHEESFNHIRTISGVGHEADQAAGKDHVSHLTLPLKTTDHTSHADAVSGLPQQDFVVPRDPTSAASSPDEGVGLSSPPEWYHSREPVRHRADDPVVPQVQVTAASTRSFAPQHRSQVFSRTFISEAPAPILLPYKPSGSEDLFYVPQTEADVSSTEQSDTTIESTHTGSDDAVPPHFSSEVLGNLDPGLDRGVAFRHAEGIYSKHLKTPTFKMQHSEHGADKDFLAVGQTPKLSSQAPASFSRVPPLSNYKGSTRDQGTNPVQFLHYERAETNRERFHPVHVKMIQTSVSHSRGEQNIPQLHPQKCSSTLDHLWQKFSTQWTAEESLPTRDREASLLERLEHLSRLVHQTKAADGSNVQEDHRLEEQLGRRLRRKEHQDIKRSKPGRVKEAEWKVRGEHLHTEVEHPIRQRLQVNETAQPEEDGGHSSLSSSSSQSPYLTRSEETETSSAVSGSVSTVNTERLIQAFCAHRGQHLDSSSSLSKLYSTISRQRGGAERWDGRNRDPRRGIIPSGTTGTDESVVPDSSSTASADPSPSHHGPSRALMGRRALKLVNKSVQAGDVELNINETRRHTRDVGTTFPSPGEARTSSFNVLRERRGQKNTSKPHSFQKRKNKRSPSKPLPAAVSWFISVGSKTKKVNRSEGSPAWRRSAAWFEPYARVSPRRETLRRRRIHEDRSDQSPSKDRPESDPDPETRIVSSGLTRVSLQEALEMCRPEFISQSRQRLRRLALQVEERKLQAAFNKERNVLFSQTGAPLRPPKPTGASLLRRAVPRREMIQRSKQIYENLPEVQRRREEERRKAEYQSYRLNAQLYNKRITNRVLGRRATCR